MYEVEFDFFASSGLSLQNFFTTDIIFYTLLLKHTKFQINIVSLDILTKSK